MQILCPVPQILLMARSPPTTSSSVQQSKVIRPLHNRLDDWLYDVRFIRWFLHSKQMTVCEQIRLCVMVVDCFMWF